MGGRGREGPWPNILLGSAFTVAGWRWFPLDRPPEASASAGCLWPLGHGSTAASLCSSGPVQGLLLL